MFRDQDEELRRLEEALLEEEEEERQRKIEEEIEEERQRARRKEEEEEEEEEAEEEEEDDFYSYQPDDTDDDEGGTFRNFANNYRAYNTDRVDVDLDEYSEEVRRKPRRGSCLLTLALSLLCGVLVMCILLFLKFLGFL